MTEFRKSVYGGQIYTANTTETPQPKQVFDPSALLQKKAMLVALIIVLLSIPVLIYLFIDSNPNPNYPSQEEILRVTPPTNP